MKNRRLDTEEEDNDNAFARAMQDANIQLNGGDDESNDDGPMYEPVGLFSREKERNELGVPQPQSECFGCNHGSERCDRGVLPGEHVLKIIDQLRTNIPRTSQVIVAKAVEKEFEKMRARINGSLLMGQTPIPPWKAATILEHIRTHTKDAEMKVLVRLDEVEEMIQVAAFAAIERDQHERVRINPRQLKCYADLVKLQMFLYRLEPQKMLCFSGGAQVDLKKASEGPVSVSGKKLASLWGGL